MGNTFVLKGLSPTGSTLFCSSSKSPNLYSKVTSAGLLRLIRTMSASLKSCDSHAMHKTDNRGDCV
jgi:hypothetical protein